MIRNLAIALLAFSVLSSCGGRTVETPREVVSNKDYASSTAVPGRFENVSGTAYFSANTDIATQLGAAGANAPGGFNSFFILLNPKVPTEGILVRAGSSVPEDLVRQQASRKLTVTGDVKTHPDPALLTYMQERHGISLARDEKGNPLWVDNSAPLNLEQNATAASPSPVQAPPWLGSSPSPGSQLPGGVAPPPVPGAPPAGNDFPDVGAPPSPDGGGGQ